MACLLVSLSDVSRGEGDSDNRFVDMSLDSLLDYEVRSPSRKVEKYRSTASSIFVIDRQQILNMGARTLRDILRVVPGMQNINNSDEQLVSIRGIFADNGSKLLVMIDGHEVNRVVDQGSSSEIPNIFAEKIERVEIIRGPGGVIYGASAFSGIINIITRDYGNGNANHDVKLSIGSFDQYKAEGVYNGKIDNVEAFIFAGVGTSNGENVPISGDEFTETAPSVNNIEGLKSPAIELYSRVKINDVMIKARYYDLDEEIPAKSVWSRHYRSGFIEATHEPIDLFNSIKFIPRAFFDVTELQRQSYRGGEFRYGTELRLMQEAPDESHSTIGGLEYRRDHFGRLLFSDRPAQDVVGDSITSTPSALNDDLVLENIGVYLQHDRYLGEKLKTTGVRFDDRSLAGNYITPRLGLVWMPDDDNTFKLLYQSATLPLQIENRGPNAVKEFASQVSNDIPAVDRRLGDWHVAHTEKRYFLNSTLRFSDIIARNVDLFITGYNLLDERSVEYNNLGYLEQGSIGRSVFGSILKRF